MTVEPIRDKAKIKQLYQYLNGNEPKYALIFKFGINTGLRISDIIPIKASDIFIEKWKFREYLIINEKKTAKEKKIKLNDTLRRCLINYARSQNLDLDGYLFQSQKGGVPGKNSGL